MQAVRFENIAVLVTGASGFIGRHLTEALKLSGADVYALSRGRSGVLPKAHEFDCDISDYAHVRKIISQVRPAIIFHLAANKTRNTVAGDFRRCIDENLVGTLNLLEACEESSFVSRLVALGTCEEYGGARPPYVESMREAPVSAYSCSKLAVTQLLQTFHRLHAFPSIILRPSLVYGPDQGGEMFLPALIRSLLEGRSFPMSHGEQTRDYIYIDDVIAALLRAATCSAATGQVINISSGEPIRIIDVARQVASLIGGGGEKLLDIGKVTCRPGEAMNYWADRSKAKELLGWEPEVTLPEGLLRTVEYYRAHVPCKAAS